MSARRSARARVATPFTVEALWQLKRIGNPTVSPDGRFACVSVTSFSMEKNEGTTELWLFPTGVAEREPAPAPKARRLTSGDKDGEPCWSPDGKWIAFTAKRKDDTEPQIYLIAADGGEARRLTRVATGASALRWFTNSRRIAFVSWVWPELKTDAAQRKRHKERSEAKVRAHVTERGEYRFWDRWLTDGREPHIYACDVANGSSRDLLLGTRLALQPWEPSAELYDIAPDGSEIALTVDCASEPGMMNRSDIVTLQITSRRVRNLTAESGLSDAYPRYSPDGRSLAYLAFDIERAFNDQGHIRIHDRKSGKSSGIARRFDRAPLPLNWTADSQALRFLAEDRGRAGLYHLSIDAAAPALLVPGGAISGYAQSRDGGVLAYTRSTASHPPALFACRSDGTGERSLEALNRSVLARHAVGAVREFTLPGWRGEQIQAWVTYPPNFNPKRKWPLLHSIHGGPHAAHLDSWHFRWNAQVFAARGYVVVGVNYHGSSGFGQKFLETITRRYGEKEYADVEAATDFLLKQRYIDRGRLVATGGSYGGYMVAFMNGHTNRYKAFVCHAGCYDWVSMMATDGYRFFAKELGAFHWDDSRRVMRQSPHHYVKHAKTPTLVIHGELDYRVPATQALQYYNSLKAKDVPARLLYFPDENHWILKPQNSRLWYSEFFAWLGTYAKGGSAK